MWTKKFLIKIKLSNCNHGSPYFDIPWLWKEYNHSYDWSTRIAFLGRIHVPPELGLVVQVDVGLASFELDQDASVNFEIKYSSLHSVLTDLCKKLDLPSGRYSTVVQVILNHVFIGWLWVANPKSITRVLRSFDDNVRNCKWRVVAIARFGKKTTGNSLGLCWLHFANKFFFVYVVYDFGPFSQSTRLYRFFFKINLK